MSDLLNAFEETHYIVHHQPPFTLRIGQHGQELDALLHETGRECAAFITAWNPMCQLLGFQENQSRQQILLDELKAMGFLTLPGTGQHPSNGWPGEESVLVLGLQLNEAKTLAKKFEQLAFVWAGRGRPVELIETVHISSHDA
jgi:Protein of unknown function (DUF3293)